MSEVIPAIALILMSLAAIGCVIEEALWRRDRRRRGL